MHIILLLIAFIVVASSAHADPFDYRQVIEECVKQRDQLNVEGKSARETLKKLRLGDAGWAEALKSMMRVTRKSIDFGNWGDCYRRRYDEYHSPASHKKSDYIFK